MAHQTRFSLQSPKSKIDGESRADPAPKHKLARYFDFGDVKMSGQMRERVLRSMKIANMTFPELALEALEMRVGQILSKGDSTPK